MSDGLMNVAFDRHIVVLEKKAILSMHSRTWQNGHIKTHVKYLFEKMFSRCHSCIKIAWMKLLGGL